MHDMRASSTSIEHAAWSTVHAFRKFIIVTPDINSCTGLNDSLHCVAVSTIWLNNLWRLHKEFCRIPSKMFNSSLMCLLIDKFTWHNWCFLIDCRYIPLCIPLCISIRQITYLWTILLHWAKNDRKISLGSSLAQRCDSQNKVVIYLGFSYSSAFIKIGIF